MSIQSTQPVAIHRSFLSGVAGIVVALLWQQLGKPLAVGPLAVYPGMIAYLYLSIAGLPAGSNSKAFSRPVWFFAGTLLVTNLPAMTIRGALPQTEIWNWTIAAGTLALLFMLFELWPQKSMTDDKPLTGSEIFSVSCIAFAMFLFFQISNRILRSSGVANEDRSLMMSGIEVHHLTWGLLLVVALGMFWRLIENIRPLRIFAVLALAVGFGMIWDQWYYYMLLDLSDDAYFEIGTVLTAILAIVGFPGIWLWNLQAASNRKGIPNE